MGNHKDPEYLKKYYIKYKEKYALKYQNNKEEIKQRSWKNRIKRKFNLTVDDYNNMVDEQKGLCAICGRVPKRKLSIDHCHNSKIIRGLLCRQCNYNLGWYEQCKEKIESYLKDS